MKLDEMRGDEMRWDEITKEDEMEKTRIVRLSAAI